MRPLTREGTHRTTEGAARLVPSRHGQHVDAMTRVDLEALKEVPCGLGELFMTADVARQTVTDQFSESTHVD